MEFPIRLNKYLADTGVASRREADTLIEAGKVLINGKKAVLGTKVQSSDEVTLVGQTKDKVYLAYYKGRGVIAHSPAEGEVDIATRLKKDFGLTGLSPVGRLDKDSEGLLIITNDGRITAPLLEAKNKLEKEYEVQVDKRVTTVFTKAMAGGVQIERYYTKPALCVPSTKNDKKFNLTLTEGKKHQIRRMCAALGYQVQALKRVRIGPILLNTLKPNQFRKITGTELKTLLATLDVSA